MDRDRRALAAAMQALRSAADADLSALAEALWQRYWRPPFPDGLVIRYGDHVERDGAEGFFTPRGDGDRPTILIDPALSETSTPSIQAVLVHELTHAWVEQCTGGRERAQDHGPRFRVEMRRLALLSAPAADTWLDG